MPTPLPPHTSASEASGRGSGHLFSTRAGGQEPPLDPDHEHVHHVRADLAGFDFSGCDLRGIDFTGAHIADALFIGADLSGAILEDVHADGAEFEGANLEGASLRRGQFLRAQFTNANLTNIDATAAFMDEAVFVGANLTGASFSMAQLKVTRWNDADLSRTDFRRADLIRADLTAVSVRQARFDDADLAGARLSRVTGFRQASWLGVDVGALDRRGACFVHDFIEDQNFLAEYRCQGPSYEWAYRLWWLTSDCGRSVVRWGLCSAVLATLFAIAYTLVGIDYGDHATALSPLYFSVVTLTTLGFGDAVPATVAAQVVVMCEVVLGYVMLGGLLSLISNKLSRRAS